MKRLLTKSVGSLFIELPYECFYREEVLRLHESYLYKMSTSPILFLTFPLKKICAVIVEEWKQYADAIIMNYYSGCEGGSALANLLSGR